MKARIITGPAYWASALVNGDQSGLTTDEVIRLNAWLAKELSPRESVVCCSEESRFTWHYALYGGECAGGDVLDYTVLG